MSQAINKYKYIIYKYKYTISCKIVQPAVEKRTAGNILQDLKVLALTFLHGEVSAVPSIQHFIALDQRGGEVLHTEVL